MPFILPHEGKSEIAISQTEDESEEEKLLGNISGCEEILYELMDEK